MTCNHKTEKFILYEEIRMAMQKKNNDKKYEFDLTGSNGNAMQIAVYLSNIMSKEESLKFVQSSPYTKSIAKLCYEFSGFNIIHELSDDDLNEVERYIEEFKNQDNRKFMLKKAINSIFQPGAIKPSLNGY